MSKVFIIDSEPEILLTLAEHALADEEVDFLVARSAEESLRHLAIDPPDVILLDVMLPDLTGLELLQRLRLSGITAPVIFTTLTTTTESAIEALKLGALDYLFKPIDLAQLRRTLSQALNLKSSAPARESPSASVEKEEVIVGCSQAMRDVYKSIGKISAIDAPVLLTGEPGTGKTLVAQAIHQHSLRAHEPFLIFQSSSDATELLEPEWLEQNSAANRPDLRRKPGKIHLAHGGTLFIREVADLPLVTQSRLLRLLQNDPPSPEAPSNALSIDVRVIAATSHDLAAMVQSGLFRADLYQRLNAYRIVLPPLRERTGDIALLTRHFWRRFCRQFGRDLEDIRRDTLDILESYLWPANVRELQNVLKHAVLQSSGSLLLPTHLPDYLRFPDSTLSRSEPIALSANLPEATDSEIDRFIRERLKENPDALYDEVIAKIERLLFRRVLEHTSGRQLQASQLLGIGRRRLREKLRALGMSIARTVSDDSED